MLYYVYLEWYILSSLKKGFADDSLDFTLKLSLEGGSESGLLATIDPFDGLWQPKKQVNDKRLICDAFTSSVAVIVHMYCTNTLSEHRS